jgi:3-deoxy-D-manno-octulosonate 8-phosphate phosphatase (KDO 8-P phosphatase)
MKNLNNVNYSDIKILIFDIDGILTDGKIYMSESGEETKCFFAHDGAGIRLAKKFGILVGFISARKSRAAKKRSEELGIDFYVEGCIDKFNSLQNILNDYNLNFQNVFYMGDDIVDIELLKCAALSASVPEAPAYVKNFASITAKNRGGQGAVREMIDFILEKKGLLVQLLKEFEQ